MKSRLLVVVALLALAFPLAAQKGPPLRVFIRASEKTHGPGEHDYPQFLADWTRLLRQRGAVPAGALRMPTEAELARTDVLVIYAADGASMGMEDRRLLEAFLGRGGGLVVLHDGLCGTNAAWFASLAGGAKTHGPTNWQRGVVGLYFQDTPHPITEGISNFDLEDELFFNVQFATGAQVIATTFRTAKEIVPQMWVYERAGARAFTSCVGHHYRNFELPHFRGLLLRAIAWVGGRPVDALTSREERDSFRYPAGGPSRPEDAIKKLRVAPEFDLSLVAAEPTVVKPISMEWDARGRLWVALTPEYPWKNDSTPGRDSIVILEGLGKGGKVGKRSVFADGLVLPTSFVFHRDGVIVSQAPQILFLRDTDGDGKADRREVLFDGFGIRDTHAVINNLRWGLDGWVYGCQGYSGNESTNVVNGRGQGFGKIGNGIFRFRPDGSAMEQVASYSGNSWGIDFNWEGELFFSKANGPHVNHVVLPERYLSRGKLGSATSDKSIEDHQKVNPIYGDKRHEYVQVAPVGVFTGASGATVYEGGAWPLRYHGSFFVSEPTVHIVHEDILTRGENPTYEATRRDEVEFMAGNDLWFRPVHTRVGPDGALYVIDWYCQAVSHNDIRGIEHGPGNAAVRPDRDHQHGRIYRVHHKDSRNYPAPSLARASSEELAHALEHPNAWVRNTAQRLLVERGDTSVEPVLTTLMRSNRMAFARVHALWALHGLKSLSESNLGVALADRHPSVLNNALRVAAERPAPTTTNVLGLVLKSLKDTAERTRLDALCALYQWTPGQPTIDAVGKLFPDLKDSWSRSAVLGIARQAPTNFIRVAYGSDKADSYRELAGPLVDDFLAKKENGPCEWILTRASRAPGGADRLKIAVLDAFAKRLAEYSPPFNTNIEAALKTFAKTDNRSLRVAAFPVIQHYVQTASAAVDTDKLRTNLLADLTNEKLKDEERGTLLASLVKVPELLEEVLPRADKVLDKGAPPPVQKSIVTELGRVTNVAAGAVLVKNFGKLNTENRQLALGTLTKRPAWALELLDAVEAGTVKVTSLGVTGPDRLRTHADKVVARRAATVFDTLQGPQVREKDMLIAKFRPALEKDGDLKNGKELFEKNCAICHRFADKGKDLGPELTGVGLHGPGVLLTHILDPNRVVEGNFVPYNVTTKKHEEYTGLLKTENRDSVTLKNLEGEIEIKRADIETMRTSGLSFMPDGLEALGEKNVRDIVSYLVSTTPKGLRTLDLSGAFTADTRRGLFATTNDSPSLAFKQYGIVMVDNVPYNIVNPATMPGGRNVIVLRGGEGFARTLPQRVEFKVGTKAAKLYVLGGVAGWGFPYGTPEQHNVPAARVTLHYADGQTEDIVLTNGEQIADAARPSEVPGSRPTGDLVTAGQVRWFTLVPKRDAVIEKITLESFGNHVAPTFVAMTAQVE